ncbi:uncharacterized protein NEMAJ01_0344 [Nematocida major]|uniref:uncharacterized protein n=1 Tax=Nematocida major TaxID=1912982 RepID=UPI0020084732|nr:uncharacterized protein NEMAJ01_0344 [Nematocida major]KAH9385448.1 hypothetical protein NEMAJ01_0344 [Nematocida major]
MLKARIKLFSIADKAKEIARFLYIEQGKVNYVRDIAEEVERIFFRDLSINQHVVKVADPDGYAISGWLQAKEAVGGKLNIYVCGGSCEKCKKSEVVEYTYNTEEESMDLQIEVEVPKKAQPKTKPLLVPKNSRGATAAKLQRQKENARSPAKKDVRLESPEGQGSERAESEANSRSEEMSESDAKTESVQELISSSADEYSDSSAGRKYVLKRAMSVQPVRKMQMPSSRYAKRK